MSFKRGQLGMSAVEEAVCKAIFPPSITVFEPTLPAPEAQVLMLAASLTHPLVIQCSLSPLPAPSGEVTG